MGLTSVEARRRRRQNSKEALIFVVPETGLSYPEVTKENIKALALDPDFDEKRQLHTMTRGNQRDLAREKAAKAAKGKSKAASEQDGNKGMTKEQRMQRDADRMREKQAAKAAAKEAGGGDAAGKSKK